jgi:hypothetical protein
MALRADTTTEGPYRRFESAYGVYESVYSVYASTYSVYEQAYGKIKGLYKTMTPYRASKMRDYIMRNGISALAPLHLAECDGRVMLSSPRKPSYFHACMR